MFEVAQAHNEGEKDSGMNGNLIYFFPVPYDKSTFCPTLHKSKFWWCHPLLVELAIPILIQTHAFYHL